MSLKFRRKIQQVVERARTSRRFEELEQRATPSVTTDGILFPVAWNEHLRQSQTATKAPKGIEVPNTVQRAGDYYMYQGNANQMLRYVDRIVVSLEPGLKSATMASLTAPGGILQHFEQAEGGFRNEVIFKAKAGSPATQYTDTSYIDTRLAALKGVPGVQWTAPVFHFISPESNVQLFAGNELNVSLKPGVDPATYFGNAPYFTGYSRIGGTPSNYTVTVSNEWVGTGVLQLTQWMQADPNLEWASPNFRQKWQLLSVPNDTLFNDQWGLHNIGQLGGVSFIDADADLPEAWDTTTGSSSVIIAISDTGFENAHPDLAANLWTNPGEAGADQDGNGWTGDFNGWNFADGNNNPNPAGAGGTNAHGTATAGIAGAVGNNNLGVSGTSQNVRLMNQRIFNASESTTNAIIEESVYYASGRTFSGFGTWHSADIMSGSWGGGAPDVGITNAFTWGSTNGRVRSGSPLGTTFMMAAGNGGGVIYPASLSTTVTGVVAVGAANELLDYMGASSGPQLDVLGFWGSFTGITTTDRVGANGYDATDYTNAFGGTSAATPHVAGIAGLMLAVNYNLTNAQIKQTLRDSADKTSVYGYSGGFNNLMGYGVANAKTAVDFVGGNTSGRQEVQALLNVNNTLFVVEDGLTTVDFGNTVIGNSVTAQFDVYNWGSATLTVQNPTAPTGFSASNFTSLTIAPGGFATFTVTLTATTNGTFSGNIVFLNDDNDTTGPENEQSYEIAVVGTVQVPSISGTIFHDWNGNAVVNDPTDPRLGGQTAYIDVNNNSVLDTATQTYNSTAVPVVVPDPGVATSTLVIADTGGILDLNVGLHMTHTWVSDMTFWLTSPGGTTVMLFSGIGGAGVNFGNAFNDMVLDDEAATPVTSGSAPFVGSWQPMNPLSAFDGEEINGTWTLTMQDSFGADQGTLVRWSITATRAAEPVAISDVNGFYYFPDLANGTYTVRHQVAAGFNYTTASNYTVTISNPLDVNPNRNFGIARQNAIYGNVFEDWNNNGINDLNPDGRLNGWTTFLDANNNGVIDSSTVNFTSSPGLFLPDLSTVSDNMVVSGVGPVLDVNVTLNITHTWTSDLQIRLQRPGGGVGDTINLIMNRGGAGVNFTNTVLDDEAANPISSGSAPFTGSFKPEQPLSTFDGFNADGTWTLSIQDVAGGDTGTLVNWTLTFEVGERTTTSNAVGNYIFDNVAVGPHNVREVLQAGWTRTTPASGVYNVNHVASASNFGNDFGNYRQNAIYGKVFNDIDGNGTQGVGEGGLAGWTVWDDVNNNGLIDTSTVNFTSSPSLPFSGPPVTNTQVVTGVGTIIDLDVRLNISHTWVGDVVVKLRRPGGGPGDQITLISDPSDPPGVDFINTVLDDEASTSILGAAAPATGSFKPIQPLSTFDGFNADGVWEIEVSDIFAAADPGVLLDWTLIFTVGESSVLSDANGNYVLQGMAPGVHNIREIVQTGWTQTAPAGGVHNPTITAGNSAFNNNFGNQFGTGDTTPPTVTALFFDSSSWTPTFRGAAGDATYGYPAQTGAGQLTTMPWNNLNRFTVQFSEALSSPLTTSDVEVLGTNAGTIAGLTVTQLDSLTYRITLPANATTDFYLFRIFSANVEDAAGNNLAGTFTENVSTFPTSGAANQNFVYRFRVAVGDADRNGLVRNPDVNLVRTNLFNDFPSGTYSIYYDITGDGQIRNADVNAVRANLFNDPPAGGPSRPVRGGQPFNGDANGSSPLPGNRTSGRITSRTAAIERDVATTRRISAVSVVDAIDALFAEF